MIQNSENLNRIRTTIIVPHQRELSSIKIKKKKTVVLNWLKREYVQ